MIALLRSGVALKAALMRVFVYGGILSALLNAGRGIGYLLDCVYAAVYLFQSDETVQLCDWRMSELNIHSAVNICDEINNPINQQLM